MKQIENGQARKINGGRWCTMQVYLGGWDRWGWDWTRFCFRRITHHTYERFYNDGTWDTFEYDQWH